MSTEQAQQSSPRIDVPKVASDKQVRFFVDEGYLVLPGLVTMPEVEELRRDVVQLARGKYPCESIKPVPDDMSDAEVIKNILCIHQPHFISPVIEKYVKHPKICGALSQIAAAHLAHWDGSVKCMQSMYFVKPPGFQGQAWHQDEVYIPTRDRSLLGAWIALDDATIQNGCLYIIPGSHRSGYLYQMRPHENPDEFDFAPEAYGFDDSKEIPVEVKCGSVVFFNGYLLHRSRTNRSNIYRRALVSHYMNAWSLLPWFYPKSDGKAPMDPVSRLDVRNVVPVAGTDPYAWKGYDNPPKSVYLRTCKANTPPKPEPAEAKS